MTLRHCQELFHDRCKIINNISITYTKILDFNPEAPSLTFLPAHEHSCHFRDLDRPMLLNLLLQKSLKFQLSLIQDLALVAVAGQDVIQQRLLQTVPAACPLHFPGQTARKELPLTT